MNRPEAGGSPVEIAFEAFGIHLLVTADPAEADAVRALLPPGWRPSERYAAAKGFSLLRNEDGKYDVRRGERTLSRGVTRDFALAMLDSQIRAYIALHAPDRIFVHAGVVAANGQAIVLPGMSFAGKTTLVAALVRAGAVYLSDEYAVLDEDGRVHPYGKPLSIRNAHQWQVDHHVESLGGVQGDQALPVGAIVETSYRLGAKWEPQRGSAGEGVMVLLANTVPAQERPEEVMRALTRAATGAVVLRGDRGEADELAPALLEMLSA